MAERNMIERLTDAVTQLRDPLPTKMLGDIETKSKPQDRPDFGRNNYNVDYLNNPNIYWNRSRWNNSAIDYRAEIGPLDNSSLVMAIVNWTGMNLAEALPVVTKPDKKGVSQIEIQHQASDLIRRPNPFHIWADYCQAGAFDWWMGNWYMKKVRDMAGNLTELWYIPQFLIEPRWPNDGRAPEVPASESDNEFLTHYQYNKPGSAPELIKRSEMVHIKRGVSVTNPRKGVGVWDSVLEEVYGDNAAARFSAAIMKNMGMTRILLSPKEKDANLSQTEADRMKQQWMVNSTGENANAPMVVSGAMDVNKLSSDPKELDLKELRNAPESRVAGVTGIPAIVLQFLVGLEHGHYGAAYEQARQQGYENVIIPIQKHISEDLTWQVLPEIDKTPGARIDFDITKVRVLAEDRDALYKRESEALRAGGISRNQFATSVGKEPPDQEDIYYVPSTSTPMTIEKLKARAESIEPDPVPPPIDPASLAKFAEMERMFEGLEAQMKGFEVQSE